MKKKKILIMEDEISISQALKDKLMGEGFDVTVTKNGEDGVRLLAKKDFALILLDLMMPKVDGFDVLTMLKEKEIKTPVIVLTNMCQESDITRAKELGAIDVFIKSDMHISDIAKKVILFF